MEILETTPAETLVAYNKPLREHVKSTLETYLKSLNGEIRPGLYDIILEEIERPLLLEVFKRTRGNESKAAQWLGVARGTLRKLRKKYDITKDAVRA